MSKHSVTVIPGDGIGPEVVNSAIRIIEALKVPISWDEQHAGESIFKKGIASGVPQETIESIKKTRVVLKGPLGTPIGYGEKSANVTLRKLFETYANIRPVREMPGVTTPFSGRGIDLVVVRENVEDLYAGIEYMQTPGVAECLKLISRKGCEKIVRFGFELARAEGRKTVACATKANIMKFTEGMMKKVFEQVAKEYPEMESYHIIIDNTAHQLAKKPEQFDVIITTNMNGDIISDLTSGLIGGLGFAGAANVGNGIFIAEAVHGSAPKYAGKNTINPTALIMSSVMMLRYLGEFEAASLIENSIMYTWEEGKAKTRDVIGDTGSVSTTAYTDALIANLGKKPKNYKVREYKPIKMPVVSADIDFVKPKARELHGADVFVESGQTPEVLGKTLEGVVAGSPFKLKVISNRGTKVYPLMGTSTECVDAYQCRFVAVSGTTVTHEQIQDLLAKISTKYVWSHVEKLQAFDGALGYTKSQGED